MLGLNNTYDLGPLGNLLLGVSYYLSLNSLTILGNTTLLADYLMNF